jgi:hypothetical protein
MRTQGKSKESARSPETDPHLRGTGDHSHARIIEPAGAKGFHCDRCNLAFRWWQYPRLAHQLGKLDPAPPNPRTLCARRDDIRIVKEKLEALNCMARHLLQN